MEQQPVITSASPKISPASPPGTPSHKQQQWGVIVSIIIIVLMIVIGAFYSWGKRIAQERALTSPSSDQSL